MENKSWSLWRHLGCLNRKYKIWTFNILKSKEGLILKLGQLIKYYIKKIFIEKYENVPQKLFLNLHLIMVSSPKCSQVIQRTLF